MPMLIRNADASDADAVARLFLATDPEVFPEAFGPADALSRYVAATAGSRCLLSPRNVRVAEVDGEVIGICVALSEDPQRVGAAESGVTGLSGMFDDSMASQAMDLGFAKAEGAEALLDCLSVDEAHRRAGVGTALLGDAQRRFRSLLLLCRADNEGARRLYEGCGFEVLGVTLGLSDDVAGIGPAMLVMLWHGDADGDGPAEASD